MNVLGGFGIVMGAIGLAIAAVGLAIAVLTRGRGLDPNSWFRPHHKN
jgi:hypothetical protein